MKKIITLIVATGFITIAAFAQDRHHNYDNRYNENGYQNRYMPNDGYSINPGINNWDRERNEGQFGYDHERYMEYRMMNRHRRHYRDYDDYRNRRGVSFQLFLGSRRNRF